MKGFVIFLTSTIVVVFLSKTKSLKSSSLLSKNNNIQYTAFDNNLIPNCIIVDCTHSFNKQITHHLKSKYQRSLSIDINNQGDSTSDTVLNIIKNSPSKLYNADFQYVTSNHFDIDSFVASFCIINPQVALKYEMILRNVAKIGDFRELFLQEEYHHDALKLACWLNSEERRLFYKPFESTITARKGEEEGEDKFHYFLKMFKNVIENIQAFEDQWKDEYNQVLQEYNDIQQKGNIIKYDTIGLVRVRIKDPGHYYSLFSTSYGYDIILSQYSDNRYEIEQKYTTFIDLASRAVLPRVELQHLCNYLNEIDKICTGDSSTLKWVANRITDSGPLLRIDNDICHLTKSERYGHPYERPIFKSSIPPDELESILVSYLSFAYNNIHPKHDYTWNDLQTFNRNIDWKKWQRNM